MTVEFKDAEKEVAVTAEVTEAPAKKTYKLSKQQLKKVGLAGGIIGGVIGLATAIYQNRK